MMGLPSATRIYVACGVSDMRRGFDGLCAQIEGTLKLDPYGGSVFIFRCKRVQVACSPLPEDSREVGIRHFEYRYHCNCSERSGPINVARSSPACGLL